MKISEFIKKLFEIEFTMAILEKQIKKHRRKSDESAVFDILFRKLPKSHRLTKSKRLYGRLTEESNFTGEVAVLIKEILDEYKRRKDNK